MKGVWVSGKIMRIKKTTYVVRINGSKIVGNLHKTNCLGKTLKYNDEV